jgi:hypothetical protein
VSEEIPEGDAELGTGQQQAEEGIAAIAALQPVQQPVERGEPGAAAEDPVEAGAQRCPPTGVARASERDGVLSYQRAESPTHSGDSLGRAIHDSLLIGEWAGGKT